MKRKLQIIHILLICALCVQAQCLNMTNLLDPSITCTYGDFDNPYLSIGVIDHGSGSEESRHTIHTYTNERDKKVEVLRTIPLGETTSIRLGNWKKGAEAESITFEYQVTAADPLLLLKYAAVMEQPGHDEADQPRLKLDVMDNNGTLIEPLCNCFDFIAAPNLGWNDINSGAILWKDWTNIGVNLENYIGQTVRIRLTNYDCRLTGHYSYSYIHVSCAKQIIEATACGDCVYFEAPAGYEYRWYKKTAPGNTLGTSQNITVPADGAEYICECYQVGKPACFFEISQIASATPRYPIADFSVYKQLGCADTLYLTNTSGISSNGVDKNIPIEPCDSAVWILDDGRQFTQYDISSIPIVFANTGKHTITLTTFLKKGNCHSTKAETVYVHGTTDPHSSSMTAEICDGESYYYNGTRLTKDSTYTFIHETSYNCDSIVKLRLIVHPRYYKTDTIYLCDGESVDYHGQKITSSGTCYANFKTTYGCDSIYKAVIYRKNSYYFEKDTTICQGDIYDFSGRLLQHPGVYWDSARTIFGCDSITKLTLHVNPSYIIPTYVEVCHDQTFMFRGRELDAPGIYYDTLLTHLGCDSIYKLVFNKTPIYLFQDTVTICEGSYYNFRGRNVSEAGFYYDNLQSVSGCDSIYQLLLIVEPLSRHLVDTVLCGGVYDFRGIPLTKSGTYYDTVKTTYGCDSIYELNLTINSTYLYKDYVEQCEGDAFSFRGKRINSPGVYYDSLFTKDGCDSIYQLVYNITPNYLQEFVDTICSNKKYNFRGKELTRPGTYIDTLQTVSGCDSLFKLTLYHLPSYNFQSTERVTACAGKTYFNGKVITKSGVYTDSLQTTCGCDSIYTLDVLINDAYLFEEKMRICDHTPYNFRGREIATSGVYEDSLVTQNGCDSIYRIEIEVTSTLRDTLVDTVCLGDTYFFEGMALQKAGVYSDTLSDPNGQRCIIHNIALGIKAASTIDTLQIPMICADQQKYILIPNYHGTKPYTYSIYYDEEAINQGFVNIIDATFYDTLYLDVPQYKEGDYLRPDYYHARIELQNGFCEPTRTGYNYNILIRYPSWIIRQHWNDVVAVLNSTYNGGHMFTDYLWEVNGRMLATTDSHYSNLYMPELRLGDLVCAHLTREGESYAIPTCPIEIQDKTSYITGDNPTIIYPTVVSKSHPYVTITSTEQVTYSLIDTYGHIIKQEKVQCTNGQQVILPSISGVYLIITEDAGSIRGTKILVQ